MNKKSLAYKIRRIRHLLREYPKKANSYDYAVSPDQMEELLLEVDRLRRALVTISSGVKLNKELNEFEHYDAYELRQIAKKTLRWYNGKSE